MTTQVSDWLGNTVSVGDRIVAVFDGCGMRVGHVVSFGTKADYSGPRETIKVQWEKGTGWQIPDRPTDIYLDNQRFLKYDS